MPGIRERNVKSSYAGKGKMILEKFLLPLLAEATTYDRITSFFTVDSLLAISQGLQSIWERRGKVRIIMGVHSIPEDIIEANTAQLRLLEEVERIRTEIVTGLADIPDELARRRVATISWMIQDGLLAVKAAATLGGGIFHPKTMIISDGYDTIAAIGSSNETYSGLGGNFEQILCVKSWLDSEGVQEQSRFFEMLWQNEHPQAVVCDISSDLQSAIDAGLGKAAKRPAFTDIQAEEVVDIIKSAREMPSSFFISGQAPGLYQHQERAVVEALSRWPVRVMLADEVGLGKTFEAAAAITFLIQYCGVRRVLILTPKAVLSQWQDELAAHFKIEAWLFDSMKRRYQSTDGKIIDMEHRASLGPGSPDICLMSAQYARGGGKRVDVFSEPESKLPDLIVVDEAHAARVSASIDGKRSPTLLYKMLERVSCKIPHIILATATPMQKDPAEYHAMLKLLGLPKVWEKPKSYLRSLDLIATTEPLTLDDGLTVARLICSTVKSMAPSSSSLDVAERAAVESLVRLNDENAPKFEQAEFSVQNWRVLQSALVKLHPASLLTIRNTRRSLEGIGYSFPKRNLKSVSVEENFDQVLFNEDVRSYLDKYCFQTEAELSSGQKFNIGFVRNMYMQRIASSLTSCCRTLIRRREKVAAILNTLKNGPTSIQTNHIEETWTLDDIEDDELFASDADIASNEMAPDHARVEQAASIELLQLDGLVDRARTLLTDVGDRKVSKALEIARCHINSGDKVLFFSRYTDTVDALIEEYQYEGDGYPYGVYDGQRSQIIVGGEIKDVQKDEIKSALQNGTISAMFCSDAASEGLNLQAARILINVDVPWTPSRLEQRIGRVARLGQRASSVDIYNIWYPQSIEARMYTRIQSRLNSLNLAIGEFPDVVADTIKNSLLTGEDDSSLVQLQEIRNSTQTIALDRLWYSRKKDVTESDRARLGLIELAKQHLPYKPTTSGGYLFSLKDGTTEELSSEVGVETLVSLGSKTVSALQLSRSDVDVARSDNNRAYAFISAHDSRLWATTAAVLTEDDGNLPFNSIYSSHPASLPTPRDLNMSFAYVGELPPCPNFWPIEE